MPDKRYELRSKGMQEITRHPPHKLTVLNNTVISLFFAISIFIFSSISVPKHITIPVQVERITDSLLSPYKPKNTFFLKALTKTATDLHSNQKAILSFRLYPANTYGQIETETDTVLNKNFVTCIYLKKIEESANNPGIIIKPDMIGSLVIAAGRTTLFNLLADHLL